MTTKVASPRGTPTGRALRMAAMSAGVAGSYVGYLLQRAFLGEDRRKAKLTQAHTRAARRVRHDLQALRGPAMKLGQALSLQSGILPDEALAELASLQREAPGMHPSLVRAQFKGSMGRYPEEIFAEFDVVPFAAASLGQVHAATTRDGRRVAVKIQYPGIRDAVANDFTWFRAVSKPAQTSGHIPRGVIDELEKQIVVETDYVHEAANTRFFQDGLRPLAFVTVPQVLPEYSSDKVLTATRLSGQHLDQFLAGRPSQRVRDLLGTHLFELFYFQVLRLGAFHADPHWGNYLLNADGTFGLVDFGCVKRLQPEFVQDLSSLFLYPGDRTSADFRQRLEKRYALFGEKLSPATHKALVSFAETFFRKVYPPEPERLDELFDFGDATFLRDYMRCAQGMARSRGMLPEYVFLARTETGLYHTLHRLRARVATSRIVKNFLPA